VLPRHFRVGRTQFRQMRFPLMQEFGSTSKLAGPERRAIHRHVAMHDRERQPGLGGAEHRRRLVDVAVDGARIGLIGVCVAAAE
jgi:hypothetical protein